MFSAYEGILSVDELNEIRDAHVEWCAVNSIDPQSEAGLDAVRYMLQAYRDKRRGREDLILFLDEYIAARQEPVRVGTAAIDSEII